MYRVGRVARATYWSSKEYSSCGMGKETGPWGIQGNYQYNVLGFLFSLKNERKDIYSFRERDRKIRRNKGSVRKPLDSLLTALQPDSEGVAEKTKKTASFFTYGGEGRASKKQHEKRGGITRQNGVVEPFKPKKI